MKVNIPITAIIATLAALFLSAQPKTASAQKIDTIRLSDKRLNTAALKPGMRQYLVYFQMPKSPKQLRLSLWVRNTAIINHNGEQVFATSQHWYTGDTTGYRTAYSLNRVSDFAPVYHSETVNGKNKSFNWSAQQVVSADTVAANTLKGFTASPAEPYFNWNLDIETFEMLPLAAGKQFAINFYDAVSNTPEYALYKVAGSEIVGTLNQEKVDCWKLVTENDYKGTHATQTFWISKKGHEFIKEEDSFNGMYRYKVKLPAAAPDILRKLTN